MDHIDKVLATSSDSPRKFCLAIRAALAIGKAAMNKYYNKTDQSELYRIAMSTVSFTNIYSILILILAVLHPRRKLEYFKKQNWEREWIQVAQDIIRDEFDRSYASLVVDSMEVDQNKDVGH